MNESKTARLLRASDTLAALDDNDLAAILEMRARWLPVGADLEKESIRLAARALKRIIGRPYGRDFSARAPA